MRPKDAASLEFWEEWILAEGYNALAEQSDAPEPEYEAESHQGGPRPYYPSRHEKMATGEELMALGIQYTRE